MTGVPRPWPSRAMGKDRHGHAHAILRGKVAPGQRSFAGKRPISPTTSRSANTSSSTSKRRSTPFRDGLLARSAPIATAREPGSDAGRPEMGPMGPNRPFGWVVPVGARVRKGNLRKGPNRPFGPEGDIFVPNSPDHAGPCRDPASPMPARAYPPRNHPPALSHPDCRATLDRRSAGYRGRRAGVRSTLVAGGRGIARSRPSCGRLPRHVGCG